MGPYFGTQNAPFIQQAQGSMTYVTGAHAIKIGIQNDWGNTETSQLDNEYGLMYKFANGVPISLEQHALPFTTHSTLNAELGIYALYAPNRYLAAKTRVLIDFLVVRFGETPEWDRFPRGPTQT